MKQETTQVTMMMAALTEFTFTENSLSLNSHCGAAHCGAVEQQWEDKGRKVHCGAAKVGRSGRDADQQATASPTNPWVR